jgi:high affinity Mn2+ porin
LGCLGVFFLSACLYGAEPQATPPDQPTPPASNSNAAAETPAKETPAKETSAAEEPGKEPKEQNWNFHVQNTDIVQGNASFPAKYSGPNSLNKHGETRETVSLDFYGGVRLWQGAEFHADALMWQGFGLSNTFGIEDFPNGDAFKAGTRVPHAMFAHLFLRQTIGFGGEQEDVEDDQLTLAGKQDISRLTFTLGRLTPEDFVDNNAYAHDPHTQFMNWAFTDNVSYDFGSDSVGYTTGLAMEFNQPNWALRYVFCQMPREQNAFTSDDRILMWPGQGADGQFWHSWAMSLEYELRYDLFSHPGKIRFMPWLNSAHMASYQEATAILQANGPGANISAAATYRHKYGFGASWEQEIAKNIGVFSRLGWNDGHNEAWTNTDINATASLGVSVKGEPWHRPDDSCGLAGVASAASRAQQHFLEAGGLGIVDGDGALNYGLEKALEVYYDVQISKPVHFGFDYQLISNPAFNRDRGPVSVFGARLHWEF